MNWKKAGFWGATVLGAFVLVGGGIGDVLLIDPVIEMMNNLEYPHYLARIIGFWKILGGLAIVAPGFRRVKEWAYAGIFFDLTGAFVSHLAVGDGFADTVASLVILGLVTASYVLQDARKEPWKQTVSIQHA